MGLLEDQENLNCLVKESQKHIDLAEYKHIVDHQAVKMLIVGEQYQKLKNSRLITD